MLHIKSNNEPVVGVDTRSGTARPLGSLALVAGGHNFTVSPLFTNNLVFKDKWASLQNTYVSSQITANNVTDNTESLTAMTFNGSSQIFLDINTVHDMTYYGSPLRLTRNGEQHLRETDAFSVRVAHRVHCTTIPDFQQIERAATFKTPTVAGESQIKYEFRPCSFIGGGWDYIAFYDQNNTEIDRGTIDATDPEGHNNTTWVDFRADQTFIKDDIKYHPHDVYVKKVGTTRELRSAQISFTTSGIWNITFDDKIALAYKNLPVGKKLRIRFVFATSRFALEGQATPIPLEFNASTKLARPSKLVSSTFSADGTKGTFIFNRQCYVSAYRNGVQITDRALTTVAGEVTINFGVNVNVGSQIELRVSTAFPQNEYSIFTVNVADTVAPPPVTVSQFLRDRIFGQGGTPNDIAVATRDDIEIGRAVITSTNEFIIELAEGITLNTGDLVEVYAMDTVGNKSASELYEADVTSSTDGSFNPNLGNDALTTTTKVQ